MVKFQKLCIGGLFAIGLSSHAVADGDVNGGISGGGGGSFPENPAGEYYIENILKDARGEMLMFFNAQDRGEQLHFFSDLYQSKPNIYDMIRQTKIGVKWDSACVGHDEKEYDGSVVGPDDSSICISVHNLGRKLTKDNALRQTLALVAHEYSHLLGYDEDKATKLQKYVIYTYEEYVAQRKKGFFFDIVLKWRDELNPSRTLAVQSLMDLSKQATDWTEVCQSLLKLERSIINPLIYVNDTLREFFPMPGFQFSPFTLDLHTKAFATKMAACGMQPLSHQDPYDQESYVRYQSAFSESSTLTPHIFNKLVFGGPSSAKPPIDTGVRISKIDSVESAKAEVSALLKHIDEIDTRLDEFGIPTVLVDF